jgi:hypothetical protein
MQSGTQIDEFKIEAGEAWVGLLFEAVCDVDARPGLESEGPATLSPIGAAGPAYGADGGLLVAVSEREADMFFLDEAYGGCEGEVSGEEDGFGVADAEGAAAVEPIHEGGSDVVYLKFGVAGE